jgi:hypothetical protein
MHPVRPPLGGLTAVQLIARPSPHSLPTLSRKSGSGISDEQKIVASNNLYSRRCKFRARGDACRGLKTSSAPCRARQADACRDQGLDSAWSAT